MCTNKLNIFSRLFVHPKFLDMLRLHSKTIMKLNSALVIFLILSSFVAVFNVATINNTYSFVENVTIVNPNDNPKPKPQYNGKAELNLDSPYLPCFISQKATSTRANWWRWTWPSARSIGPASSSSPSTFSSGTSSLLSFSFLLLELR